MLILEGVLSCPLGHRADFQTHDKATQEKGFFRYWFRSSQKVLLQDHHVNKIKNEKARGYCYGLCHLPP